MNKTLILDLDGTIIETKSGKTFPADANDWKFKKDVLKTLVNAVKIEAYDWVYIHTNQEGVNEGYMLLPEFINKLDFIIDNIHMYLVLCDITHINIQSIIGLHEGHEKRKPCLMNIGEDVTYVGDASGKCREINYTLIQTTDLKANKESGYFIEETGIFTRNDSTLSARPAIRIDNIIQVLPTNCEPGTYYLQDFSDSDKKHAELNDYTYYDIDDFIKKYK